MAIRARKKIPQWWETKSIRHDLKDFFRFGVHHEEDPHHPFLVLRMVQSGTAAGTVDIMKVSSIREIPPSCPNNALIIKAWQGKDASDFFRFTVKELREQIARE